MTSPAEESWKTLRVERREGVAYVWLNRPERRNAINQTMLEELTQVFRSLQTEFGIRVVVLGGKGLTFCAGADRKETPGLDRMTAGGEVTARERRWFANLGPRALDAIENLDCITISRLHGHAIGGGFLLALACDLRIAAAGTAFIFPEVELGTPLDWRGVPRLAREAGFARARDMVFLSQRLEAAELAGLGILNRVVPEEQVDATLSAWCNALLARDETALHMSKRQFRAYAATLRLGDASLFEDELLLATIGSEVSRASFRTKS